MSSDQQILDRVAAFTPRTTFAELEAALGPPARDIGSGLYIFVYPLQRGELWVRTADRKRILDVRLVVDGKTETLYTGR